MAVGFKNEKIVNVRIGTSFTSIEAARKNLDKEIPDWNFEALRKSTEDVWNQTLGKIQVKGGSEDDLIKFYTALYHCYQLPRIASDVDGSYQGFAQDTLIHKAEGFDYYDDFSMWDTYRALHPLMTILEPEKTLDMVKSLVLKGSAGWLDANLPGMVKLYCCYDWRSCKHNNSRCLHERDNSISILKQHGSICGRMHLKHLLLPIIKMAKDAGLWRVISSTVIFLSRIVYGMHFTGGSRFHELLNMHLMTMLLQGLQMHLGKTEDYNILIKRSENWKNVFDKKTGFVRGRYADGRWIEPFDPYSKARFICEGTPFQYTWYVPQNIPGLMQAMGGKDIFLAKLNEFFDKGHYWHGNETDHQAAYIFAMAGKPEKTQEWVNKIVAEEYGTGPGGLSGNEDAGQMSAWLVFSMMGFYPVCPASNQYIITTPAFDEIKVFLPGW